MIREEIDDALTPEERATYKKLRAWRWTKILFWTGLLLFISAPFVGAALVTPLPLEWPYNSAGEQVFLGMIVFGGIAWLAAFSMCFEVWHKAMNFPELDSIAESVWQLEVEQRTPGNRRSMGQWWADLCTKRRRNRMIGRHFQE